MKVWVVVYDNKYGADCMAFDSLEKARAQRVHIANSYWDKDMPSEAVKPEDAEIMADAYFDYVRDFLGETLSICEYTVK